MKSEDYIGDKQDDSVVKNRTFCKSETKLVFFGTLFHDRHGQRKHALQSFFSLVDYIFMKSNFWFSGPFVLEPWLIMHFTHHLERMGLKVIWGEIVTETVR